MPVVAIPATSIPREYFMTLLLLAISEVLAV
jgi:hypothetical protein